MFVTKNVDLKEYALNIYSAVKMCDEKRWVKTQPTFVKT